MRDRPGAGPGARARAGPDRGGAPAACGGEPAAGARPGSGGGARPARRGGGSRAAVSASAAAGRPGPARAPLRRPPA
ncbi:hypothetical protein EF910_28975, partial [Streptomyces sp. WAC07149]